MSHNLWFRLAAGVVVLGLAAAACSEPEPVEQTEQTEQTQQTQESEQTEPATGDAQLHPDVLDAVFDQQDDGLWTVAVTLSSPYDSPERYADAWRVTSLDGETTWGVRELTHDHADEQPFTRSQSGIEIPSTETTVLVQGRDQANGWGEPKQFDLPQG